MAFLTGNDQQIAYTVAKGTARALRQYCVDFNEIAAANNISGNLVLDLRGRLLTDNGIFSSAASVPGIVDYVKEIEDDPTYDVAAEFSAMQTAVEDTDAWIVTNYPADENDWLQHQKFTSNGIDTRAFTPTQTNGLRAEVQNIIDAIEEPLTTL